MHVNRVLFWINIIIILIFCYLKITEHWKEQLRKRQHKPGIMVVKYKYHTWIYVCLRDPLTLTNIKNYLNILIETLHFQKIFPKIGRYKYLSRGGFKIPFTKVYLSFSKHIEYELGQFEQRLSSKKPSIAHSKMPIW